MEPVYQNTDAPAQNAGIPFIFHGQGAEYFRIWIVNLLLSIGTFGIYSAWAKVRRLKYFYGQTELAGSRFDYDAPPLRILKGRLIAGSLLLVYVLSSNSEPRIAGIVIAIFWLLMPWFVVRSLKFNTRYTSYRNIPFAFDGSTAQGYKYYLLMPILAVLTLGLALPYVFHQQHRFVISHLRYGDTRFEMQPVVGSFYRIYLAALGVGAAIAIGVVLIIGLGALGLNAAGLLHLPKAGTTNANSMIIFTIAGGAVYLLMILMMTGLSLTLRMAVVNATWSNTSLGDCYFESQIPLLAYARTVMGRLMLTLFTLGLALPWFKIALMRKRLEGITVFAPQTLDRFISHHDPAGSATGSEVAEFFDLDLSL